LWSFQILMPLVIERGLQKKDRPLCTACPLDPGAEKHAGLRELGLVFLVLVGTAFSSSTWRSASPLARRRRGCRELVAFRQIAQQVLALESLDCDDTLLAAAAG
jgi:hypothetical protein